MLTYIEFVTNGREGEVVYHSAWKSIRFYMGFGGNEVIFYLSIPKSRDWQDETGFPLSQRNEILQYVANETKAKQAPSSRFEIGDDSIVFYEVR